MLNIGGGEMLVIMLLALIVLGPQRLPDAAKQVGKVMGDLRRMSSGFQNELRSAMDDPVEAAARERGAKHRSSPAATTPTPVPDAARAQATEAVAAPSTPPKPTAAKKAARRAQPAKKAAAKRQAAAKKAAPRKRAAPLRAPGKPDAPTAG